MILGIGKNDADYKVTGCPYYLRWKTMIVRAYDKKYHKRRPSYEGVTVCKEWLTFSNFKRWMETQDWQGKEIDKDILVIGNKEYSPTACCFVLSHLNACFTTRDRARGDYMIGVSFENSSNKFRAQLTMNGKHVNIGRFYTEIEAHKAYIKVKIKYIKSFYPTVPKKVRKGLKAHIKEMKKKDGR